MATLLTLTTGRQVTVASTFDDVDAALKPRTLQADNGMRVFQTAEGEPFGCNVAGVLNWEPAESNSTRQPVGFR